MRFINFDDIVNKNNENYINKNVFCLSHPTLFNNHNWKNRMWKTNLLLIF